MFKFQLHTIFLSLFLLPPVFIHTQEATTNLGQPNVAHFNNNLGPTYNAKVKPKVIVTTSNVVNAIGMKIGDIYVQIKELARDTVTKENYNLLKKLIKDMLWQSRYKIVGGTIAGSYSAASLLLLADYHRAHDMFWVQWKQQLTFEDLCSISQKELAKQLMLEISKHHFNKDNPTDLGFPLITFIKEIEGEIAILKRYISTVKTIKYLHLVSLFPTNDNKLLRVTKMLERVIFIKHIFLSWLADYNLAHAEQMNG
jgi:hypothetical protein